MSAPRLAQGTAWLSHDAHYKYYHQHTLKQRPSGLRAGVARGMEVFKEAAATSALGIAKNPMYGMRKEGAVGFAKGVVRGTFGGGAKMISGAFFLPAKALEGLQADLQTRLITKSQQNGMRVRQPRELRETGLLPYPPSDKLLLSLDD